MNYLLVKQVHISWQIMVTCFGILIGIVLAAHVHIPGVVTLGWLLTSLLLVSVACVKQRAPLLVAAFVGGLIFGLWRGDLEQGQLGSYKNLHGATITLRGVVSDDIDTDRQGNMVVRLKDVLSEDNQQLSGALWVVVDDRKMDIERSDLITVTGKLEQGFGIFNGAMYRADIVDIQRPEPGDIALRIRDWFADAVRLAIPEPESALGVGYLVGQRRNLPDDLDAALKIAGLTHIVVASGYNLTILVRLARRLFERISKYQATLVSGSLIIGFIAVTGMSPSMSRAGLVTGLSLAAWYYGRKFHPLVLLALVAAITVFINPYYAWGDVGWQLSFAAFVGVMIFAPLMQTFYFGERKPGILRQILGETIAATICTAPILLFSFGQISNVAIVANLLILPLVPLAMLLTFIAGTGALIVSSMAYIFGFPAYLLLSYMTQTVEFLANIPWAITELQVQGWHVVVMYALLIVFMIFMRWRTEFNLRDSNIIE